MQVTAGDLLICVTHPPYLGILTRGILTSFRFGGLPGGGGYSPHPPADFLFVDGF